MNAIEQGMTALLRSAITGEKLPLPEDFQLKDAAELIRSHGMVTLAYVGAANCGISPQDDFMKELFRSYCSLMLQSEAHVRAIHQLCSKFEEHEIDYMPLKGSKMKFLYPKPELRLMGDADILIRLPQYTKKIVPIMQELGFQFREETDHELVWIRKDLMVELHKRLIPSNNETFNDYFRQGMELAVRQEGHRYALPAEEEFLYLFTHFTKHFRGGGIGCRHVVDLWVYRRANPELDEHKLRQGLQKLGLLAFYENICHMMDVWFGGAPADEKTDFLTNFIFSSGSWGTPEQHALVRGILWQGSSGSASDSRIRYIWAILFPRRLAMQREYGILKRFPWLLPILWIWRILRKAFTGIKWKDHRKAMNLYTQENLDEKRLMLDYVGLKELS